MFKPHPRIVSTRTFKRLLLLAAIGLSSAAAHAADDANPVYASWAKCKPGTSVRAVTDTDAMGQKSKMEITTTLVEGIWPC